VAVLGLVGWAGWAWADTCAPGNTACQQLQQARQSQAATSDRLAQIEASLTDAQQKADQVRTYLDQLLDQISHQQAAILTTATGIADTERQIRLTEADIVRRQAHLDVREALLAQRVRAMDKAGPLDYLELAVTARTFNQLVDRVAVMQQVVNADQKLVDQLRLERAQLGALQINLRDERTQEVAQLAQQQAQETQLELDRNTQQAALAYYQQLEARFTAQRQDLEAEKAYIDGLVAQLQGQYDGGARSTGGGSGRFSWPESGPITQGFGCTDLLGEPYDPNCPSHHFHTGIDVGAPYGTAITAADSGIVSYTNRGWGGGYGNFILITHGNGYATLYAHLSAIDVSPGQAVRRGQVIGAEGSTGYSTGPHLHFEIRLNGAYENPLSFLA
jgi:murein DD-endopeptidase MepM/ murein hydrolase activator NlpD